METRYALIDKQKGEEIGEVVFLGQKLKPVELGGRKLYIFILPDFVEDQPIANAVKLLFGLLREANGCEIKLLPKTYEKLGVPRQSFYYWLKTLTAKDVLKKVDKYVYHFSAKGLSCKKQAKNPEIKKTF